LKKSISIKTNVKSLDLNILIRAGWLFLVEIFVAVSDMTAHIQSFLIRTQTVFFIYAVRSGLLPGGITGLFTFISEFEKSCSIR